MRVGLRIDLKEALSGVRKTIVLRRHEPCPECNGTGAQKGGARTCATCRGYGQVESNQGFFRMRSTCPHCGGRGQVVTDPCTSCEGQGRIEKQVEVEINVPRGVETGVILRVQGEGERSQSGGAPGDLLCEIVVAPHPVFERRGRDLVCEVPITYPMAVLGGEAQVPTLEGDAETLKVPRATPSGTILHVTGRGLPEVGGTRRGDLLVRVVIEVPGKLTEREEELLRELAEIEDARVAEEHKGLFAKIKEYLSSLEGDTDED
jgi:molecular chaperone DnaJ